MLTAAQLQTRRAGIGSSDIAPVCGISSWGSPLTVWLAKRGEGGYSNALHLRIGSALEPLIGELYTEQTGEDLVYPGTVFVSPKHEWQLATPDFFRVSDDGLVEGKIDQYGRGEWGEPGTDQVPHEYLCQTQWQMDVLGKEYAHIAAIIGGVFKVFVVQYDADLCEALRDAAARFWHDYVLTGVQPPVSANDNDRKWLQERFASHTDKLLIASDIEEAMAREFHYARQRKDGAEQDEALAGNQLRQVIGDAAGIQGSNWKATWKAPKPTSIVDWEAVAMELGATPELAKKHTVQKKNSRRFLFTWKGGE